MIRRNDNYYDYYLEKYWKNKTIPPDKPAITQFSLLDDKILFNRIKKIIFHDKFLKKIYDQHMLLRTDLSTLNFMMELIKQIDKYTDVNKLFLFLMNYGVDPYINFSILDNPIDDPLFTNNMQIILISPDSLSLPNKLYYTDIKNKNILEEFYKYQRKLIDKLNLSNSIDTSVINEIEHELAKRSHSLDDSRNYDIIFNKITLDELIKKFNNIDFISIFKSFENDTFFGNLKGMYDAGVYNKLLITYNLNTNKETPFDYIHLLFKDINKTKIYVKWRLINSMAPLLIADIAKLHYDFYNKFLNDQKEEKKDDYKALLYVGEIYSNYISQIYIKKYYDNKITDDIKLLIKYIKKSLKDTIINNKWMELETKKIALKKLKKMSHIIAFSKKNYNFTKVIENVAETFIENRLLINRLYKYYSFYKLKIQKKIKDPIDSYEVNASYSPLFNYIIIPAGILNKPFYYNTNIIDNFGAIGLVIGHEITHGFDSQSSKMDYRGKYVKWWKDNDFNEYNKLIEPLIDQFNKTRITEIEKETYFDGKQVIQEAIAELYGMVLALRSLKLHCKLNRIKLTRKILKKFFRSYVIIWLTKQTEKAFEYKVINAVHPINKYRVNVIIRNLDEFHFAYKTKPGEGMYLEPEKRVKIF